MECDCVILDRNWFVIFWLMIVFCCKLLECRRKIEFPNEYEIVSKFPCFRIHSGQQRRVYIQRNVAFGTFVLRRFSDGKIYMIKLTKFCMICVIIVHENILQFCCASLFNLYILNISYRPQQNASILVYTICIQMAYALRAKFPRCQPYNGTNDNERSKKKT